MATATKVLLLKDVGEDRSGNIIRVKPGFARNYLIPQGYAVVANKHAVRQQERLQEERLNKALADKAESDKIAAAIEGISIVKIVKVDHDGHMYGSVTAGDIVQLLQEHHGVEVEKRAVQLAHPIKATGVHAITLKLKEGVQASITLKAMSEEGYRLSQAEQA